MRTLRTVVLCLAATLVVMPAFAYTIILKDGSRLLAKNDFRIEEERAIITLLSGTETFLALSEIDVEATREANRNRLGSAMVLQDGKVEGLEADSGESKTSLQDLIQAGQAGPRTRPEAKRPIRQSRTAEDIERTPAGFEDLTQLQRMPHPELEIMTQIRGQFMAEGLNAQVFQGTSEDSPLVEIRTNSEAAVFGALEAAAASLLQLRDRFPDKITRLELLMVTPNGERGGQFAMTQDLASHIATGSIEVSTFFVENVQF